MGEGVYNSALNLRSSRALTIKLHKNESRPINYMYFLSFRGISLFYFCLSLHRILENNQILTRHRNMIELTLFVNNVTMVPGRFYWTFLVDGRGSMDGIRKQI